jgi:ABC-type dipeptide/oligopeptide/nickel transport system permease component
MPGGPGTFIRAQLLQQGVSEATIEERVDTYLPFDPDTPLWTRYIDYLGSVLQGDLGVSITKNEPVASILAEALPWTVLVMGLSLILTFTIAIIVGSVMAYVQGTRADGAATSILVILNSIPYYVIALILLFLFAYGNPFRILPSGGRYSADVAAGFSIPFVISVLTHLLLPVASMVLGGIGGRALAMRGNSLQVLGTDHLRAAQIRGLKPRQVVPSYVIKNAVLPMYTGLMISIGFMFGGSVILEVIFSYPGIGWYFVNGISARDYPLVMGAFLLIAIGVLAGVTVADLTYSWIDPRIQSSDETGPDNTSLLRSVKILLLDLWKAVSWSSATGKASNNKKSDQLDIDPDSSVFINSEENDTQRSLWKKLDRTVFAGFRVMWSSLRGKVGISLITLYLFIGTIGVHIIPQPAGNGPRLAGFFENLAYPLGTTMKGQGLFRLIVHATPDMLLMVTSGALFSTIIATVVGALAGYKGGNLIDRSLMFVTDIMMILPALPLILILASFLEPQDPIVLGLILSVNAWAGLARTIRSEILSLRENSYVEASEVMGVSTPKILAFDILPNVMPYITINFASAAKGIIFNSVGLYFLGILPFSTLNWGVILNFAYNQGALYSWELAHWFIVPMFTILTFSLGLILAAQAADRIFKPQLRLRHAKETDTPGGEEGVDKIDSGEVAPSD